MGQLHNEIRSGSLTTAITRALGITRQGGVERFSETMDVVLNIWGMPEWAYLRGERLCGWIRNVAAGAAATFAGAALCNPAGNKNIVVLEAVSVIAAVATDTITMYMATDADIQASFGASSFGASRDRRNGPSTFVSESIVRYGTPAAVPTAQAIDQVVGNATLTVCLPIVIPPGQGALLMTNNDAAGLNTSWAWRERKAYPNELV